MLEFVNIPMYNTTMKKLIISGIMLACGLSVSASPFDYRYSSHWKYVYHPHNESSYQHAWCSAHNGIEEYENTDKTRVDCLTDTYAVEFDFANKYYEAIGQALHYGIMTGKKPKVVLILDSKYFNQQMRYYERIKRIGEVYKIDVEYVSDDILNLDKDNKCSYADCKCQRTNKTGNSSKIRNIGG